MGCLCASPAAPPADPPNNPRFIREGRIF